MKSMFVEQIAVHVQFLNVCLLFNLCLYSAAQLCIQVASWGNVALHSCMVIILQLFLLLFRNWSEGQSGLTFVKVDIEIFVKIPFD